VFSEFPSGDDQAAEAWFSAPRNRVFTSWETCVGEKTAHWKGLELGVQTITGQPNAVVSKCGREAVREAYVGAGMKSHTTKEQKDKIGRLASQELIKKMKGSWKDASASWLQDACRTLAPRFVHLWKKAERERKAKSEADTAKSEDGEAGVSTAEKRAKLGNGQARAVGDGLEPATPPRKKPAVEGPSTSTPIPQSRGDQFLLCERDIEVSIEPAAEAMELDTVDSLVIAVSAIVHSDAFAYQNENIRTEHLSFDKFCSILASTSLDFDFRKNGYVLTYQQLQGFGARLKEVHRETDFQVAVGILAWEAQKEGSGKPLMMQIKYASN
jgi:hypothetical protein